MTTARTIEGKVADWKRVYDVVREEIVPPHMRLLMANLQGVENAGDIQSYVTLSRLVMRTDSMAALVAAVLTTQGVKVLPVDSLDD